MFCNSQEQRLRPQKNLCLKLTVLTAPAALGTDCTVNTEPNITTSSALARSHAPHLCADDCHPFSPRHSAWFSGLEASSQREQTKVRELDPLRPSATLMKRYDTVWRGQGRDKIHYHRSASTACIRVSGWLSSTSLVRPDMVLVG